MTPEQRQKMRESQKRYFQTEKGKAAKLRGQRKYLASENGRKVTREGNQRNRTNDLAADCHRTRMRQLSKQGRVPSWADAEMIKAVYAEAARLTIETGIVHQVDHIVPLHSPIVSGLHWHRNLRPLPAGDNAAKSNLLWPDMPDDPQDVVVILGIRGKGKRVARAVDIAAQSGRAF